VSREGIVPSAEAEGSQSCNALSWSAVQYVCEGRATYGLEPEDRERVEEDDYALCA